MPGNLPPPVAPPPVTVASQPLLPIVVPTADAIAAPSDHDAVVGRWGIEARRYSSARFPLSLRSDRGCPTVAPRPCTVEMGALGVRTWSTRNLAINGGLAFALGGGREDTRSLDTYIGGGPIVGMTLLLGNWKHLAVGASPELGVVVFKPGGGTTQSTTLVDLRASLEGSCTSASSACRPCRSAWPAASYFTMKARRRSASGLSGSGGKPAFGAP